MKKISTSLYKISEYSHNIGKETWKNYSLGMTVSQILYILFTLEQILI